MTGAAMADHELNIALKLDNAARLLGREFPSHSFRTMRLHGVLKLVAERNPGAEGAHTLVSEDPEEIRAALEAGPGP